MVDFGKLLDNPPPKEDERTIKCRVCGGIFSDPLLENKQIIHDRAEKHVTDSGIIGQHRGDWEEIMNG